MKVNILNLIDFEKVNILLEGFNKTTGFVTAILDLKGNVLSKSGWRQICTNFHRIHPESSGRCTVSDTVLAGEVGDGEEYHYYKCLNGLVDVAVPIVINDEHVANLFTGQFFFDEPDREFFRKQAIQFGFEEDKYIEALEKVPVVSKEKVKLAIEFLLNMTQMISEMTFQRLEQLNLNEALKKSEERTRSVLDNMLEGCQIIGYDWRYLYLNLAAETQNRRPNSELLGNRFMDMWSGIENTKVFKIIDKVLKDRIPDHLEIEYVFPDGNNGWFDLSIQPVPEGVFILSIDITDAKKSEELLYESEFRFVNLYENGPFGMVMATNEFRFKKANAEFCKILGYSEEELQMMTFKDISHPDDLIKDMPFINKLLSGEINIYKTEKRYIRKDGQIVWALLTVIATYDRDGNFLYYLAIIDEITDIKNAKKALQESENRFKQVAENAMEWIWEVDSNGLYTYSSPVIKSLLGYTEDELVGKKYFYDFFPPEKREKFKNTALTIFKNKGTFKNFENQNVHKNGQILTLSTSGSPVYDDNGNFEGYRGIDTDYTERTKMLQELISAKEKAEEGDKLKTAFINNISHEIRTPLNGILGFGQLLSESDLTIELRKEYYNIIQQSSNRLINTVSDYLDMSRLMTGAMSVNKLNFPILSLIEKVKRNAEVLCEEKKLGLESVIPSEHLDLVLYSDIEIINKVFNLLLDNSIKYTKQGQISFGYSLIPGFVEFFVNDTGIGIESDNLETIFVMFSQEDPSSTRGYEGSGLGLTIANGLITLLGGKISVISEKGKGSSFTFTIPYNSTVITEKPLKKNSDDTAKRQKPLLLIAEDDELNFMYVEVIMNMIDCDYLHAVNGVEAVEICKKNSDITMVLMDIKMPVMNGLEATKLIHKFNPELPIIATTAYAQTGSENKFLAAGCNGYLAKPIKKDDLLKMIEKYIIL